MGIKLGQYEYRVQPVYRAVHVGKDKHKATHDRVLEYKRMDKAMRMYTGMGIGITIDRRI